MLCECRQMSKKAEFFPLESILNDMRMLANVLVDIDHVHRQGHMDPAVFGAIVGLVAAHMQRIVGEIRTECQLNAD